MDSSLYFISLFQSAFLSFLSGKLAISKQKHVEGRQDLRQSLILQSEWRELRAACVKELMWSHVCLLEWDEAKECAESLLQGTAWCPQLYHFLIAGFLQAKEGLERVQTKKEPYFQQSAETQGIIRECMKKVKELSEGAEDRTNLESMMMDQATAYVEEGKDLLVPVIEVMYESNRLRHMPMDQMAKITVLLEKRVFKLIRDEDLMADLEAEFGDPLDGYAKLYLLISVCHKYARPKPGMDRDSHVEYAIYKLKNTLEKKRKIKDTRVIARTTMHLGMMLCDARKAMEGRFWLETVEQDHADVLTLSECIMIDQYLRQSVPETDDDFQQPRKLSLRRSSAVDVQAKMLKQLARRRSGSIGYEHSGEFAAQPPSLLAGHIPGILTE